MTTPKKTVKKPRPAHVDHTSQPFTGATKIDASAVASLLVDLPPGGMQGLRKPLSGIDGVVAELAAAVPTNGTAAGIPAAVYASFVTHTTEIAALQAVASDALKLAEVLTETIAVHEDAREQNLGQIVDAIRSTAKRTKAAGIGAPFAKTLAYRAQVADKAVATKKKKAAAAATATPAASTATSATPATTPAPTPH